MKRRIIKQGKDSFTLTLPKSWIRSLGLKGGDEIDLLEEKGLLIIGAKKAMPSSKLIVNADKFGNALLHYLCAVYRGGVDEIEITFSESNTIETVQKILSDYLIGFEIVSQGKGFCIIKSISMPLEAEFETILNRFFLQTVAMAKSIAEAIKNKDLDHLKDVRKYEIPINRFSIYCRRTLNKRGIGAYENAIPLYAFIDELEIIADSYKHLCDYFLILGGKIEAINPEVQKLLGQLFELLEQNQNLFHKFSEEKAVSFWKKKQEVLKETLSLFKKSSGENTKVLGYIINIIELLTHIFYLKMTIEVKIKLFEKNQKETINST